MNENNNNTLLIETCFMTLSEEKHFCNKHTDTDNFQKLCGVEFAAHQIFANDLRLHYALKQQADDEELIFFIRQFFSMHCPANLSLRGKEKIRHYLRCPIRVFESQDGQIVLHYIQTKLARIISHNSYSPDPRFNPMSIYRGALKINKMLKSKTTIIL